MFEKKRIFLKIEKNAWNFFLLCLNDKNEWLGEGGGRKGVASSKSVKFRGKCNENAMVVKRLLIFLLTGRFFLFYIFFLLLFEDF